MDTKEVERIKPLYRGTQIVWGVVAIIDILLAFRFLLKVFAANEAAGFTNLIYIITTPLAGPFIYVFDLVAISNSIIEWGTLLAILVYTLIGAGIMKMLVMGKPVSTIEAAQKLDEEN